MKPSVEGVLTLAAILYAPLKPLLDKAFPEWEHKWNRAAREWFQLGTHRMRNFLQSCGESLLSSAHQLPEKVASAPGVAWVLIWLLATPKSSIFMRHSLGSIGSSPNPVVFRLHINWSFV